MKKFIDLVHIRVKAGDGGAGAVSFHREKYLPKGGPDGGDGGKGGDVYILADKRLYNLSHFFKDRLYKAGRGKSGSSGHCFGKNGEDLIIKVPLGTQVVDLQNNQVIADLIEENQKVLVSEGGLGGKGNSFFKSATNRTPRYAQPGIKTKEIKISLNLKLIADIGLVGLPNAGKSTLLAEITRAKPKIDSYPFTTLIPNLGVIEGANGKVYKLADIPGIIAGAHKGSGLGLSFLQHIERVKILFFLLDASEDNLKYNFELLRDELKMYNENLLKKPFYIILTKVDLITDKELESKTNLFPGNSLIPISVLHKKNIPSLLKIIDDSLDRVD